MKLRYLIFVSFLFLAGCSEKVYVPHKTEIKKLHYKIYHQKLSDYSKNSLTFSFLTLKPLKKPELLDKLKIVKIYYDAKGHKLGKFVKINKDIAVNANKMLIISTKKVYKLPYLIYSATKKNSSVALVFDNDKYGLYDLKTKSLKYVFDGDEVLSVTYLHANPLFYKDLILYPMLNGNVAVVDAKANKFIRYLNISQKQFNDNVIFLKIVNNQLFMATPSKLVLFNPKFLVSYKAYIKHIIDYKNNIYIFTVDGSIVKLNSGLKVLKKVNLPYASFFAPSICKGNIWTVERGGYLIKISPDLNVTVYQGNNFGTKSNSELRLEGCKIYNDHKVYVIE